jgi:hypothetical protein
MTDWASHFQNLSAQASRAAREAYAEQYDRTVRTDDNARRTYARQYQKAAFGASIGDVLSYRTLWNDYVMGMARALVTCADAWDAAAAAVKAGTSPLPDGPNYSRLSQAAQASPDAYSAIASSDRQFANDLVASWNLHAGMSEADMLTQATSILEDFQKTVLRVGQFYQLQLQQDCPNLPIPSPPSPDAQKQVISQLQGAGLAAQGVLQIMGIGVDGALQTAGSVVTLGGIPLPGGGPGIKNPFTSWLPSKTTLAVGGVLTVVGLLAVAKIVK